MALARLDGFFGCVRPSATLFRFREASAGLAAGVVVCIDDSACVEALPGA